MQQIVRERTRAFPLIPERLYELLSVYTTPNCSRLSISIDSNVVKCANVDFYAVLELAQGGR